MGTVQVSKQKLEQLKTAVKQLKSEKRELEKKNQKLQGQKSQEGKWKKEIKRLGLDKGNWVEPDAEKLMDYVMAEPGIGKGTAKKIAKYAREDGGKILLDARRHDHPKGWKK